MNFNYRKVLAAVPVLLILFSSIYSCKEDRNEISPSGDAIVRINMLGSSVSQDGAGSAESKNKASSTQASSGAHMPISSDCSIDAILTDHTVSPQLFTSNGNQSTVRTKLKEGVQYRILVYDEKGDYLTEKSLKIGGSKDEGPWFNLTAGSTYTFVVYSLNNERELPEVTDKGKLKTAKLTAVSADLLYFSRTLEMSSGENVLDVVMNHSFSEITVNLVMDLNMTGYITQLSNPSVSPTHTDADVQLADGTVKYNWQRRGGTQLTFPALGAGVRQISSKPSIIISPNTNEATLHFPSIALDGEVKKDLVIKGLNLTPGHKYTLELVFKTCTENVTVNGNMKWSYPEVIRNGKKGIIFNNTFMPNGSSIQRSFNAPGADYGFVFDLKELDNAFNLTVNNVSLATKEIQFQDYNGSSPQNIRFKDGSYYEGRNTEGGAKIPAIYSMQGTDRAPLIKVVISRTGEVKMYGAKRSGGRLYELELYRNTSFNKFPWNGGSSDNTVKVSHLIDGRTVLIGTGSGRKKVPCK